MAIILLITARAFVARSECVRFRERPLQTLWLDLRYGHSYSSVTQDPIAAAIAAIAFGERAIVPNVHAAILPQSTLSSYQGYYQFGSDFFTPEEKFRPVVQSRYLLMQFANGGRPLIPLSPTEFLERDFFGHVAAEKDGQGKVNWLDCSIRYARLPRLETGRGAYLLVSCL